MGIRLTSSNDIELHSPTIMAKGESAQLRCILYGTGGSLGTDTITAVDPDGVSIDITGTFADISSYLPFTFITVFMSNYQFSKVGVYSFIYHETTSGDAIISHTYCSEWASRIDMKLSQIFSQRTDIDRIRNLVGRKSFNPAKV